MANVTVTKDRYTVEPLYQWDLNQDLVIKGLSLASIPEIHFTNETMDRALVRQASMDSAGVITAKVPNSLLQKPYKITAYVCIDNGGEFKSLYAIDIPVKARKKPDDYTFEDSNGEIYSFNALENMVANALDKLESDREDTLAEVKKATDKVVNDLNSTNETFVKQLEDSNKETLEAFRGELEKKYDDTVDSFEEYKTVNNENLETATTDLKNEMKTVLNEKIIYSDFQITEGTIADNEFTPLIMYINVPEGYEPISATVVDGIGVGSGMGYFASLITANHSEFNASYGDVIQIFIINKTGASKKYSGKVRVVFRKTDE